MASAAVGFFNLLSAGASAAVSAVGTVSAAASVLQGVATAGSVLAGLSQARDAQRAGRAASREALVSSDLARIEGDRNRLASETRALQIQENAIKKIASARVAFGASGADVSSGQLVAVEGSIESERDFGLAIEKSNQRQAILEGDIKSGQFVAQAGNARAGARSRSDAAKIGAIGTGAKGLLSIIRRG